MPEPETSSLPDAFDLHDLEAMQTIINQCAHAMAEKITSLERQLQTAHTTAEDLREARDLETARVKTLRSFTQWIYDTSNNGTLFPPEQIAGRAHVLLAVTPTDNPTRSTS